MKLYDVYIKLSGQWYCWYGPVTEERADALVKEEKERYFTEAHKRERINESTAKQSV